MIIDMTPTAAKIPACLLSAELFCGSHSGEHVEDLLLLEIDRPDERLYFTLHYSGPLLGAEHLNVWKALYTQRLLRDRSLFNISIEQIMQLLGCSDGGTEQQKKISDVLYELNYTHLRGEGARFTKGGKKNPLRLISRLGNFNVHEGNCEAFVGPGLGGFPDKLEFETLPVSAIDIEVASRPAPDIPLLFWPDEQLATNKPKPSGPGFVYILTNPSMPGLIKIGKTRLASVEDRAAQLHSTGVPDAFEVVYVCRTDAPDIVERIMHEAFGPKRVNGRREFFQVQPEQAAAVLALHHQGTRERDS